MDKKILRAAILLAIVIITILLITNCQVTSISKVAMFMCGLTTTLVCLIAYKKELPLAVPLIVSGLLTAIPITIGYPPMAKWSHIWMIVALSSAGFSYLVESKPKIRDARVIIGIYWMLIFIIGVLLFLGSIITCVIYYSEQIDILKPLCHIGVVFIISSLPSACIEARYNFALAKTDFQKSLASFVAVLSFISFIILCYQHFF